MVCCRQAKSFDWRSSNQTRDNVVDLCAYTYTPTSANLAKYFELIDAVMHEMGWLIETLPQISHHLNRLLSMFLLILHVFESTSNKYFAFFFRSPLYAKLSSSHTARNVGWAVCGFRTIKRFRRLEGKQCGSAPLVKSFTFDQEIH